MKLMMKTDKFKMTSQSEPLINLVNYYRDRVESNEHERRHWYSQLDQLRIPQEYVHKLDWEIKKRTDETTELNRVLSEAHINLYSKRDEIQRLKQSNELLKLKERENRKTILDLLALNNSIEQHVHFYKGSEPEKMQSFARTSDGQNIFPRDKDSFKSKAEYKAVNPGIDYTVKTPNILRTIYMENDDISNLRREIEQILQETEDEKAAYEAEIEQYQQERSKLDEYARQDFLSDQEKIDQVMREIADTNTFCMETFKDHCELLRTADKKKA